MESNRNEISFAKTDSSAFLLYLAFYKLLLLAYVPFTFRQVLGINLLPWLGQLAGAQPWLMFLFTALLVFSIFKIEKKESISPEDRRELLCLLAVEVAISRGRSAKTCN